MALNRLYFLLFAGGFSISVLLSKLVVLWVDQKKQIMNVVLYISWLSYLIIQLTFAWTKIEDTAVEIPNVLLSFSTLFYNVSICSILYMSMQRNLVLYPAGDIQRYTKMLMYPLLIVLFIIRTSRSIVIFISNSGEILFPHTNILHAITMFPILVLRNFYDMLALNAVIKMKQLSQTIKQPKEGKYANNRALKTLVLNLSIEIFLSVFSLGVATVEAFSYQGSMVSYIDWLLISWALGSAIDQKQLYRAIFRAKTPSDTSDDEESLKSGHVSFKF